MPTLSVRHLTRYRYRRPVAFGEHRMMFRPCESWDQRLLDSSLIIAPRPANLRHQHDVFGNCVSVAAFEQRARALTFKSEVRLEHTPASADLDANDRFAADSYAARFTYGPDEHPDLAHAIDPGHPDPDAGVERWSRRFMQPGGRVIDTLGDMTHAIHGEFRYAKRLAVGVRAPAETLHLQAGSCRDFAMLMIEASRRLGLAARFVSGYIYSPQHGASHAPRVGGGHTHAWMRVYLPSQGWVDFDPTNGIVGGEGLIRVAVAREPRQALPLHGSWFGADDDYLGMDVEVDVRLETEPMARRSVPLALAG